MNSSCKPIIVQGIQIGEQPSGHGHQNTITVPPPPPADGETTTDPWALPLGWQTATSPRDGRIYYWETSTGKTSWSHPNSLSKAGNIVDTSVPPIHQPQPEVATTEPSVQENTNKIKAGVIGLLSVFVGGTALGRWAGIPEKTTPATPATTTTASNPNGMKTNLLDGDPNPNATVGADSKQQQQQQPEQPDNYRWLVVLSLILCLPLGAMAMYHQSRTQTTWNNGQYMRSDRHSRQSLSYAAYGIVIGLILLVAWITHRAGVWDFPPGLNFDNFKLGDLFDFKR